ncbi:MAG: beta-galactosidase [Parvularculaceae bacterium]
MRLGICYYPEQWDRALWRDDAKRMADLGLSVVRLGEFAWSEVEPARDAFEWSWLDEAIDVLTQAGLELIVGTPTATPPKWLVDARPDILALDAYGRPRRFGSRRHYCFSSPAYREEARRIVTLFAERYGGHASVVGWQTDNEYGCHDTVRSYSPAAATAFRNWLRRRYGDVAGLNEAWGAAFWSQRYGDFDEVDLPNLTVTEPNPSHVLDFRRFSSDAVVSFNRLQTDILRELSPGRDIYHNFMGFFTDFDHFQLSEDVDVAGWDSYPLGFLDVEPFAAVEKRRYMRQGHPDFAAFHHDLYRRCGRGRFAVLEQQPGPVNWAANNAAPLAGRVRLWTHEAAAHGAELVSYFRWRQTPAAQEQMHAGLRLPDDAPSPAFAEVGQCAEEAPLFAGAGLAVEAAPVALVFSYETQWMSEIQPYGEAWNYLRFAYEWYTALRRFGLNVDIRAPGDDLSAYALVAVPSLFHVSEAALDAFKGTTAEIAFGPRTGSRTREMRIPANNPPGPLRALAPLKTIWSESPPPFHKEIGSFDGKEIAGLAWLDHVETDLEPLAATAEGVGLLFRHDRFWFMTTRPDDMFLQSLTARLLAEAGVEAALLDADVRRRSIGEVDFAFNYGPNDVAIGELETIAPAARLLGAAKTPPAGVAAWKRQS